MKTGNNRRNKNLTSLVRMGLKLPVFEQTEKPEAQKSPANVEQPVEPICRPVGKDDTLKHLYYAAVNDAKQQREPGCMARKEGSFSLTIKAPVTEKTQHEEHASMYHFVYSVKIIPGNVS